jgi:hypothetical protein
MTVNGRQLSVGKIIFAISGITNLIRPNMVQSSTIRPDMTNTIFVTQWEDQVMLSDVEFGIVGGHYLFSDDME